MKKLRKPLIIIISLFIFLYPAWLYRDVNALVIMGGYYGAAGCTPSTPGNDNDEIGMVAVGASVTTMTPYRLYAWLYEPDCSGDLGTAYIYSDETGGSGANKILIFSTTDTNTESVPTNGTTIGSSGAIASDAVAGWDSGAMSGGSVTTGTKY